MVHTSCFVIYIYTPHSIFVSSRCQPYIACSADSQEGFCSHVDTTCTAVNTCRTCSTFTANGGSCVALDYYPNATVAEYGIITGNSKHEVVMNIKKEIKARVRSRVHVYYLGCMHFSQVFFNQHIAIGSRSCYNQRESTS